MKKEDIINEKLAFIDRVHSLKALSDDLWFLPLREGSWGIADVISHFIAWDQFMIDNRISYLLKNEPFPQMAIDVEEINRSASRYARSGITKDQLIDEFISIRKQLLSLLRALDAERFARPLPGRENIILGNYFIGMIEHDQKHMVQIESFINQNQNA
ncbi:DinB family protein [Neobacillus sp. NPDC058068]|uniref:DinB family protein n=1 Tax=Neobacillus sp. NPDC058068 TaxID=3346325 RepID=UPI0036DC8772